MSENNFQWPWQPWEFISREKLTELATEAASRILEQTRNQEGTTSFRPCKAVVLGSVMQDVLNEGELLAEINFSEILPFEIPGDSAASHKRKLELRKIGNEGVWVLRGRVHFYEVLDQREATFLIRVLKSLGVEILILTNAAGGTNKYENTFQLGDLVIANGIYNINMPDPLGGLLPVKFIDPSQRIDPAIKAILINICEALGIRYSVGLAAAITGPSYEDEGQRRLLGEIGALVAGMSVVNEIYVAAEVGLRAAAISVVTDLVWTEEHVTHEGVMKVSKKVQPILDSLLTAFLGAA